MKFGSIEILTLSLLVDVYLPSYVISCGLYLGGLAWVVAVSQQVTVMLD